MFSLNEKQSGECAPFCAWKRELMAGEAEGIISNMSNHSSQGSRCHLVTGATGNIGARVVSGLVARGERPRVLVRDADKGRALFGDRVDYAAGDLADPGSLAAACAGVDAVFLVNGGPDLARRDGLAARAARSAGVRPPGQALVAGGARDRTPGDGGRSLARRRRGGDP